jgi:Na+/proline symporter
MKLSALDIAILIIYFAVMIGVGVYVTRRASKSLDSYFLGGKTMPWWLLGVSNASAMWDITGTMWLVYLLFVYGLKAVFIPWLWPVFNQVFDAVYISKWIRRSNTRTGAQWITTRFGSGVGGELSRAVILLFALISVTLFISYDFQGMGKFCKVFLPWDLSPSTYAIIIMSVTAIYVVLGGMLSVVLTDFAQFILMALSAVVIAVIAMMKVDTATISQVTPTGWNELFFGWNVNIDWSSILPAINDRIAGDGYTSVFGIFFMIMVFKGILVSMAGAAPNYDMQRILAAKNPREAGLMSAIVSLCLVPRWLMIAGITLIGLVFITPEFRRLGGNPDFELVLPYVINNVLPAGFIGFLLAGLLSSFMSTFSATVNAGAAYLVNDLYHHYIDPQAPNRRLIWMSYLGSVLILIVGMAVGYFVHSINQATLWITAGLFGGYATANVLKWYWWRLNGFGYFAGMLVGIASASVLAILAQKYPSAAQIASSMLRFRVTPDLFLLYGFPLILLFSGIAAIAISLMTKPVDEETLKTFYRNARPWGFWKPVHEMVVKEDPSIQPNRDAIRDLTNVGVGIAWQLTLVTIPVYIVFRNLRGTLISIVVLIATSLFLKKFWYDRLEPDGFPVDTVVDVSLPSPQTTKLAQD